MAILTKAQITKGQSVTFTLQLNELLALPAVSAAYFQDYTNLSKVEFHYKSTVGNQRKIIKFNVAGLGSASTPVNSSFPLSSRSRDSFAIQKIVIRDRDGGYHTILRSDLTTAQYDADTVIPVITLASAILTGNVGAINVQNPWAGTNMYAAGELSESGWLFFPSESGNITTLTARASTPTNYHADNATTNTVRLEIWTLGRDGVKGRFLGASAAKVVDTFANGSDSIWTFPTPVKVEAKDYDASNAFGGYGVFFRRSNQYAVGPRFSYVGGGDNYNVYAFTYRLSSLYYQRERGNWYMKIDGNAAPSTALRTNNKINSLVGITGASVRGIASTFTPSINKSVNNIELALLQNAGYNSTSYTVELCSVDGSGNFLAVLGTSTIQANTINTTSNSLTYGIPQVFALNQTVNLVSGTKYMLRFYSNIANPSNIFMTYSNNSAPTNMTNHAQKLVLDGSLATGGTLTGWSTITNGIMSFEAY